MDLLQQSSSRRRDTCIAAKDQRGTVLKTDNKTPIIVNKKKIIVSEKINCGKKKREEKT